MAKKKRKSLKSKQKSFILIGSMAFIIISSLIVYSFILKPDVKTNSVDSAQKNETAEQPSEQTIEFTRQIFTNTYKFTASDNGDGYVIIKEMDLRFPKSDDYVLGYWIAAKINGTSVGASVADFTEVNELLNEKTAQSLQKVQDCYEGLAIFATDKPTGYQYLFKKQLQDGRTYEVRQGKKECTVYIGGFTDYLSKAESI